MKIKLYLEEMLKFLQLKLDYDTSGNQKPSSSIYFLFPLGLNYNFSSTF